MNSRNIFIKYLLKHKNSHKGLDMNFMFLMFNIKLV